MFVIGSTSFPLYSLAIAYTNDWIEDHQRVAASGQLVLVNGVGAVLGPLIASLLMRQFNPSAYFFTLTMAHAVIVVYLGFRIIVRDPIPVDEQSIYQAGSGPLIAQSRQHSAEFVRRSFVSDSERSWIDRLRSSPATTTLVTSPGFMIPGARKAGVELREDIDTVLAPGMVVSMEPIIMIPEGQAGAGGYREHDVLVINHDGSVENITKFPYGPEHSIIG